MTTMTIFENKKRSKVNRDSVIIALEAGLKNSSLKRQLVQSQYLQSEKINPTFAIKATKTSFYFPKIGLNFIF